MVRLLIASAGLARGEEIRRVENLRRKMELERGVAGKDHVRKVAAERAAGEERKRLAKHDDKAERAEKIRDS